MSLSPIRIWPAVGSSRPATIRSVVVLPQPDGPSRAKNDPCGIGQVEVVDRGELAERLGDAREPEVAPASRAPAISSVPHAAVVRTAPVYLVSSSGVEAPEDLGSLARTSSVGKISGFSASSGSILASSSWAPATGQM